MIFLNLTEQNTNVYYYFSRSKNSIKVQIKTRNKMLLKIHAFLKRWFFNISETFRIKLKYFMFKKW